MRLGIKKLAMLMVSVLGLVLSQLSCSAIPEPDVGRPLTFRTEHGPIPEGHDKYILFISTSLGHARTTTREKIRELDKLFKDFGEAIGPNNVAVWVNEPGSDSLSVSMGRRYADILARWAGQRIEYSDGPFILLLNKHPDTFNQRVPSERGEGPLVIVIGLRTISVERVVDVMDYLLTRIRRSQAEGEVDRVRIDMAVLWERLKSFYDKDRKFFKDATLTLLQAIPKATAR